MEIVTPDQFSTGYKFSPKEIRSVVSPRYSTFLKEAGYADLSKTLTLLVAYRSLKFDNRVRTVAEEQELNFLDSEGYVTRVNQANARKLIHALGGKLLTSVFMYKLLIPSLKEAAKQGSTEAEATLSHMKDELAWHLEDRILDGRTLVIGDARTNLVLPQTSGMFNRSDLNEFGYPNTVKQKGEFRYWPPNGKENIVIRSRNSELVLNLDWAPADSFDFLGVVFAKFF